MNQKRMKKLYLLGRKFYEYHLVKYMMFGRFLDQYMIDEPTYRRKKMEALALKRRITKSDVYKGQRDVLFQWIYEDYEHNIQRIARECNKRGYSVDRTTISKVIHTKTQENEKKGVTSVESTSIKSNGGLIS